MLSISYVGHCSCCCYVLWRHQLRLSFTKCKCDFLAVLPGLHSHPLPCSPYTEPSKVCYFITAQVFKVQPNLSRYRYRCTNLSVRCCTLLSCNATSIVPINMQLASNSLTQPVRFACVVIFYSKSDGGNASSKASSSDQEWCDTQPEAPRQQFKCPVTFIVSAQGSPPDYYRGHYITAGAGPFP